MSISLHDATVGRFLQQMGGVAGVLDVGLAFAKENGIAPDALLQLSLIDDMKPLWFQIQSAVHYSLGGIKSARAGAATAIVTRELDYAGHQQLVTDALAELKAITPAEVDALADKDVLFKVGDFEMPFTGQGFLLSFSVPNFYFHATTTYDLLRRAGAPLGKQNYLGALQLRG